MLGITSSMSLIFLRFNYKNMNTDINFIKVEKKKKHNWACFYELLDKFTDISEGHGKLKDYQKLWKSIKNNR